MEEKDRKRKVILLVCNIFLIVTTIAATWAYSSHMDQVQKEAKTAEFIRTIETMKQVSRNYLDSERGYAKNWASYITEHHMTMADALDFLREINTNKDRYVHIVDMDTYEAYSAFYPKGEEKIDTYVQYKEKNIEADVPFGEIMESMFNETDEDFTVLGKYRLQETHAMAVGIGARVTLATETGEKAYLLLRIIPTDNLKKTWVFPTDYASAEVGIITNTGDYVIQSASMKSQNFREYIRGYNFQDDYTKVEELKKKLQTTDSGLLEYKNFRGTDCLWYYSSFGENSALDILGMVSTEQLKTTLDAWYIIGIVCGILIILAVIDGVYLISMNRRLREAAKASEQASKAKTQFLSAMSHDIRTPLNAVLGMMTIAEKKADDPKAVRECMDKGKHAGRQLLTLINDVLDISKIESGMVTLNEEQVSLDEMIHDLTEMILPVMEQKGIRFASDFSRLPDKYIRADKMRLSQIYMNLLTNAVKYTEKDGQIRLQLYEEALPERAGYTRLVFCVEDTGIGMTEEFQTQMYSTFTREVKTQVNTTQGSGLGLSIVKQMVELMNGEITCESAPGKGTTFTVTVDFPVLEGCKKDSEEQTAPEAVENMHLLVAEDNELNWEIACEMLAGQGVTCDRAENGRECIDMLLKAPAGTYQAILMDIQMPVMNGYEAARKIRRLPDERKRNTIIIAMTADAFAEDVQACADAGMNGHIAKPIDMKKLIAYLTRIKRGQL